jgi:hypothetical protein
VGEEGFTRQRLAYEETQVHKKVEKSARCGGAHLIIPPLERQNERIRS